MSSDEEFDNQEAPSTAGAGESVALKQEDEEDLAIKKRKMSRACDVCRKRKVRCDFVQLPSGDLEKCLNCFSNKVECTFSEESKPRKTSKGYIKGLESKVERSEKLLELLCPDPKTRQQLLRGELDVADLTTSKQPTYDEAALESTGAIFDFISKASGKSAADLAVMGIRLQMFRRYPPDHEAYQDDTLRDTEADAEEDEHLSILNYQNTGPRELHPVDHFNERLFLGKSSTRTILQQAIAMKEQRSMASSSRAVPTTNPTPSSAATPSEDSESSESVRGASNTPSKGFETTPSSSFVGPSTSSFVKSLHGDRRPEFWESFPWEKRLFRPRDIAVEPPVPFRFPEARLLKALVDKYFKYTNLEFPLLHRPTLEKDIAKGLHRRDAQFGSTVLLVCAIGARYLDDPAAKDFELESLHEWRRDAGGDEGPISSSILSLGLSNERLKELAERSKGWGYFEPAWAAAVHHVSLSPPSLHDLQFHCLVAEYLIGSPIPQSTWLIVGIGIRLAQEVGAHRKKYRQHEPMDPERMKRDELWKRACWVLVTLDRFASAGTGRPCALQEEDFDLDLPVECDDEYWDNPDPALRFKQPPGKPSLVTAFSLTIRLNQIMAIVLRTIYSLDKMKLPLINYEQWLPRVVSEIDSALNKWFDTIPPHLRWDPDNPNEDFFTQSAGLHTAYYSLQILVHRPFIPRGDKPSEGPFPSMSICANAARNLIRIGKRWSERTGELSPYSKLHVFSAGVVMLLRIWEAGRLGQLTDAQYAADMADVETCLDVLKGTEKRFIMGGKLWDMLNGLANAKPDWLDDVQSVCMSFDRAGKPTTSKGKAKDMPPVAHVRASSRSKVTEVVPPASTKDAAPEARVNSNKMSVDLPTAPSPFFVPPPRNTALHPVPQQPPVDPSPFSSTALPGPSTSPSGVNGAYRPDPNPSMMDWKSETSRGGAGLPSQQQQAQWSSIFATNQDAREQQQGLAFLPQQLPVHPSTSSPSSSWGSLPQLHPGQQPVPQQQQYASPDPSSMLGGWDGNWATALHFPGISDGLGGFAPGGGYSGVEASSAIVPPGLWSNDHQVFGGHAMLDDWGSYLTGVSDLTSRYDLDFVFPSTDLLGDGGPSRQQQQG